MEEITRYLTEHHTRNVALFASYPHQFFKVVTVTTPPPNVLVADSSPYVRPLAALDDQWETFTLVLMNTHRAKIYALDCSEIARIQNLSENIMNKHKKGGWSQARFQRLRQGSIQRFYQEVHEILQSDDIKNIVLAGPGPAKEEFKNALPAPVQDKIIAVIDADIDENPTLWQASIAAATAHDDQVKQQLVEQLTKEIRTDGLAAYGLAAVTRAARAGQVDVLLVDKGFRARGWLCERCQRLEAGTISTCPTCGGPVTTVDLIEEIIEFAERTDATVTFVESDVVTNLGHIAALLRYR
jgi:peptide chain release factor subunit 1